METVINSQLPLPDDIDLGSLEYLFSPTIEVSPVAPLRFETPPTGKKTEDDESDLHGQIRLLQLMLNDALENLSESNMLVGYQRGLLVEKNEQLKQLPQLRLWAAKNIAAEVENRKLQAEVDRLNFEIAEFKSHLLFRVNENVKQFLSGCRTIEILAILDVVVLALFLGILVWLLYTLTA